MELVSAVEIIAVILGVLQSILILLNRRSNWYFYIGQMVALAVFSFLIGMYGNVMLDFLYIGFGVWGLVTWGKDDESITRIKKEERWKRWLDALAIFSFTTLFVIVLPGEFKCFDILTVGTSILATLLMVKHKLETWIVWFINDILYVVTYFQLPDQPVYLIIMYIFWTGMAVASYIAWRKKLNNGGFPAGNSME